MIWGDLAAALEGLSAFESTYASVGCQPTAALTTAARAAAATKALGAGASARLSAALQPLRDHGAALPNAVLALQQRQRQLLTAATLQQDLDATRLKLERCQLAPGTKGRRVEELRQQVAGLEASQAAAAAEYDRLALRNRQELASLKAARGRELAQAVVSFLGVEWRAVRARVHARNSSRRGGGDSCKGLEVVSSSQTSLCHQPGKPAASSTKLTTTRNRPPPKSPSAPSGRRGALPRGAGGRRLAGDRQRAAGAGGRGDGLHGAAPLQGLMRAAAALYSLKAPFYINLHYSPLLYMCRVFSDLESAVNCSSELQSSQHVLVPRADAALAAFLK
jgi:hypothetical protein